MPTMAARFTEMMQSSEAQNWGYRKLLLHLCEAEAADRRERKRERLLRESRLPSGKTLGNLADGQLPAQVRRQLPTLLKGGFVERAENLLVFGLPGRGKTHFLCALGRELLLRRGCPVYFTPTFKLVRSVQYPLLNPCYTPPKPLLNPSYCLYEGYTRGIRGVYEGYTRGIRGANEGYTRGYRINRLSRSLEGRKG